MGSLILALLLFQSPNPFHPDGVSDHPEVDRLVLEIAPKYGIDPRLLHALLNAENFDFRPHISSKGARGIAQIMPFNEAWLGVTDPNNDAQEVAGAARYLQYLSELFNGDTRLMVAAYNAGENRVARCWCVPPIAETQEYVPRVMGFFHDLQMRWPEDAASNVPASAPAQALPAVWEARAELLRAQRLDPELVAQLDPGQRRLLATLLAAWLGFALPPSQITSELAHAGWYEPVPGRTWADVAPVQLNNYAVLQGLN